MTLTDLLRIIPPDSRIERETTGLKLLAMRHRFFIEKFNRAMAYALSPADVLATDWRVSQ